MIAVGMFVVSKGVDNPWVYHVSRIDRLTGIAHLQFVGHNGQARPNAKWIQRDKTKAITELEPAKVQDLRDAWGVSDGNALRAKANEILAMLRGESPKSKPRCDHEWQRYTGFRESYKYCCKCDAKMVVDD